MSGVTQILEAVANGDPTAADELLPLVYEELRRLAAAKMAHIGPGQTLQPTALVHEAWLRLVEGGQQPIWNSRGHFFAAAAESMRRILVERARRQSAAKHGVTRAVSVAVHFRLEFEQLDHPGQPRHRHRSDVQHHKPSNDRVAAILSLDARAVKL